MKIAITDGACRALASDGLVPSPWLSSTQKSGVKYCGFGRKLAQKRDVEHRFLKLFRVKKSKGPRLGSRDLHYKGGARSDSIKQHEFLLEA
jgi:hypothetical protein